MADFFHRTLEDGVLTLTYDRPPINSVSYESWEGFSHTLRELDLDDNVRVLIFAAARNGRGWISGADLREFQKLDPATRKEKHQLVTAAFQALHSFSRPTIAAITGHAFGGGMAVASLCDMRVASAEIQFAMPEVDRGLTGGGGAWFHRLNLPAALIREMIFTGRKFSAEEMKSCGFLNYVVEPDAVMGKARDLARTIAAKSLPAIKAIKKTANMLDQTPDWWQVRAAAEAMNQELIAGPDFREAIAAFFEKRPPKFR